MKSGLTKQLGKVLFSIVAVLVVGVGVAACDGGNSSSEKPPHDDSGTAPHTH